MNFSRNPEVLIIGAGPGGYVSAIKLAQSGFKVTLAEKNSLGGTCLNEGCIPTKVLLHITKLYDEILKGEKIGINVENLNIDFDKAQNHKEEVVKKLVQGVEGLSKSNGVTIINGKASFINDKKIKITSDKEITLEPENIIISTGSKPVIPNIEGMENERVLTSKEALSLKEIPEKLLIIGGGVIGVELALIYKRLGSQVTIVEMLPEILPMMDKELSIALKTDMEKQGIKILTDTQVKSLEDGEKLRVKTVSKDREEELVTDYTVIAAGRKPNIDGLNLEKTNIKTENGRIIVDKKLKTNLSGIYAVGDVTGINMLAHVASYQGEIVAESIKGKDSVADYKTVPSCVYSYPEIASVGLTEKEAKSKGYEVKIGVFPLQASGKAMTMGITTGFIKIVSEKKYNEVLGVHIYAPGATELITEGALGLHLEATLDEYINTIHSHPTISEGLREAAMEKPIHLP